MGLCSKPSGNGKKKKTDLNSQTGELWTGNLRAGDPTLNGGGGNNVKKGEEDRKLS